VHKQIASEIEKKGIIKIDNFLDINEIKKISKIIKYYSAPKNTPESYFPTNFKAMGLKILNLNFIKFFHSLEILKISKKKKLEDLANEFFKNKSELRFIDAYYSKISIKDVLPWHTDQAYSGEKYVNNFNDPDKFYLKIFIYLTDVEPDDGCMSYIPGSHKIGYAIRSAVYKKHIKYQPYWSIRDFKQIIIDNKEYFTNYFNNSEIINNFLKEADLLENMANKEKYGYSAKAGSAIVFDEGGVHKGSRPRSKDRMVLRYLYSPSNKIK